LIARNCMNSEVMNPARFVQRSPAVTFFFPLQILILSSHA
jgi:hypothetical protein